MRVGNWRILFDVEDRIRIIMIQEVKKRDERTY
jgi:mRNA-degrading endonuclease RelE of RelBE toxin-antitoxin system